MKTTLSTKIAEYATKNETSTSNSNRTIILALKNDIIDAINDGWSIRITWKTLKNEKQITFSYETFRLHVNRFLPTKNKRSDPKNNTIKDFNFNSVPNEEVLF